MIEERLQKAEDAGIIKSHGYLYHADRMKAPHTPPFVVFYLSESVRQHEQVNPDKRTWLGNGVWRLELWQLADEKRASKPIKENPPHSLLNDLLPFLVTPPSSFSIISWFYEVSIQNPDYLVHIINLAKNYELPFTLPQRDTKRLKYNLRINKQNAIPR